MTYCCNNIKRAYELIGNAKNILDWSADFSAGDGFLAGLTLGVSSNIKQSTSIEEAERRMVNAYNTLCDARNAINDCNCASTKDYWKDEENKERQRANNLVNEYNNLSSTSREEYNSLVGRYNDLQSDSRERYNGLVGEWNELKDKYNGMIDKYNDLARNSVSRDGFERLDAEYKQNITDYNRLVGEHNGLQERNRELGQRFNRLNEDIEELREKNEEIRTRHEEETRSWHQEELRLSRNEERLRQEGIGLREQLTDTRQQLTNVTNEKNNLQIRVNEKNTEIQALTNQMTNLRIESNNRNNQLQVIQQELTRTQEERDARITPLELQEIINTLYEREREADSLRQQLGQSQESSLTERIRNKTQRLESFVHRLGIEWEQIQLLRDIYNELVRSRRDGDMNGVRENQNIIDTIKQNLLQARVRFEDVQEMCDKCEEIAQLNLQLGQQFEARIEVVPPRRY